MLTRDQIFDAVSARDNVNVPFVADPLHAAVAIIMAEGDQGPDVCLIRRAEREGDPWSGHVSFPGGRAAASDPDPLAVAERETFEEIGLQLIHQHRIGSLPALPKIRKGLTLFPFVYFVDEQTRAQAKVNAVDEVASVFWVPLDHLSDKTAVTRYEYDVDGQHGIYPGIQFQDHVIWGLTLHLLHAFAGLVRQPFPALD